MLYPNVDPIPIPAPVWLMKTLSLLTLALHFFAVQILIGSLLAAAYLSYRGQSRGDSATLTAAGVVGRRLPIVMTYVINLGIPPLLFAQVLYGRALYTSSVLIAVLWISVVFLLVGCYWLLYRVSDLTMRGKSAVLPCLFALVIAGLVGNIYTFNMTLMLRPEVWHEMYAKTASGLQLPPHDPTIMPRWFFMMVGGLIGGGLWLALNSNLKTIEESSKQVLRKLGAGMATVGAIAQTVCGLLVYSTQPAVVQSGLGGTYYKATAGIWLLGVVLVVTLSLLHYTRKSSSLILGWGAPVGGLVSIAGFVMYRDGIRDLTLLSKGYDVWKRTEVSNWSVIGIFLVLLVAGLGVLGWLLAVMKQAKAIGEEVNA